MLQVAICGVVQASCKQWGTVLFDGSTTEKSISLPLKINNALALTTFAYGSGVHSVFGGWHETDKLHLYRHSFFSENVNCVWFGIFYQTVVKYRWKVNGK